MWNAIATFLDSVLIGPMWPASILMGLLLCYLLLSLFGAVDLDFGSPDADLDLDIDLPDAPADDRQRSQHAEVQRTDRHPHPRGNTALGVD